MRRLTATVVRFTDTTNACLPEIVGGDDAKHGRHTGFDGDRRQPVRDRAGDVLRMARFALHQNSQPDHAIESARLGKFRRGSADFETAGHADDRCRSTGFGQRVDAVSDEGVGKLRVVARSGDAEP